MKCNYYESNKTVSLKQISEQSNESYVSHSNRGVLKRGVSGTSASSFDIEENEPIYESAKELDIKIVKSLFNLKQTKRHVTLSIHSGPIIFSKLRFQEFRF